MGLAVRLPPGHVPVVHKLVDAVDDELRASVDAEHRHVELVHALEVVLQPQRELVPGELGVPVGVLRREEVGHVHGGHLLLGASEFSDEHGVLVNVGRAELGRAVHRSHLP